MPHLSRLIVSVILLIVPTLPAEGQRSSQQDDTRLIEPDARIPTPPNDRVLPLPPDVEAHLRCNRALEWSAVDGSFRPIRVVASLPDEEFAARIRAATSRIDSARPDLAPALHSVAPLDATRDTLEEVRAAIAANVNGARPHRSYLEMLDRQSENLKVASDGLDRTHTKRQALLDLAANSLSTWPSYHNSLHLAHAPDPCTQPIIATWFWDTRNKLEASYSALAFNADIAAALLAIDQSATRIRDKHELYPDVCANNGLLPVAGIVAGVDCGPAYSRLLLPYYSRTEGAVAIWAANRPVVSEVLGFLDSVVAAGSSVSTKYAEFNAARYTHATDLRPPIVATQQELTIEFAGLERLRVSNETEETALITLKSRIDQLDLTIVHLGQDLTIERGKVAQAQQDLRLADVEIARLRAAIVVAREGLSEKLLVLDAIALNCAGSDYAQCRDQAAKDAYNERRYNAYEEIGLARAAVSRLQGDLATELDRRQHLQEDKFAALSKAGDIASGLAENSVEVKGLKHDFDKRTVALAEQTARYSNLRREHDVDADFISELLVLIAS